MAARPGGNTDSRVTFGEAFAARYREVVASIYIYNEHRGYTALDRVLEAVRRHCPDDPEFIAAVAKHRRDERKHYVMFRRWFERQERMPLALDRTYGHIDHFVRYAFGCSIDDLDTERLLTDPAEFERLLRVIVLTEERGLRQVEVLLKNRAVLDDPVMTRIFRIVHEDEPDHFLPYRRWLSGQSHSTGQWNERLADWFIHKLLLLAKMPALFFDAGAKRLTEWPDAHEPAS